MRAHIWYTPGAMDFLSVILVALSLSADCLAVALTGSASMARVSPVQVIRTSSSFGLFQFSMPLAGWLAGRTFVDRISIYDHWIAFALLVFIGAKSIRESLRTNSMEEPAVDITRGAILLTLSVATSIDALAVGLSLAALKANILSTSILIGTVAFAVTAIGFVIGRKMGRLFGKRARLAGGIVLIAIGFKILIGGLAQ